MTSTGPDANSLERYANEFAGGMLHLCSDDLDMTDDFSNISTVSEASIDTDASDWDTTTDGVNEEVVLENTAEIDFGDVSGFTVEALILEHPSEDEYVQKSASGDTDLSGDGDTSVEAGGASFTLSR